MHIADWFAAWKFDPVTSIITLFGPIALYVLALIRRPIFAGVKYVVQGTIYRASIVLTRTVAASLTLRKYCEIEFSGSTKYLSVPGLRDINLDIDQIFVPLALEQAGVQQVYDHSNILTAGHRLRIVGDPGSGKSSIAKRIFRDECKKGMLNPRAARFPILLELRKIPFPKTRKPEALNDWLYNYIRTELPKLAVYELQKCFDVYSKSQGLLIVLDGLDEISTAAYPNAQAAINGLASRLSLLGPNNVILLTMRLQFHLQVRASYLDSFPIVLTLKPFTPTDIYAFLQRWEFPPAAKRQQIVRIYTELTDRPTLREMCANPLVLSMYVAQDQASGHPIVPESRTEFYTRVTDELLIRRRAAQIGAPEGQAILREQRQRILGRLAFEHLIDPEQPANLLS